MNSIDSVVLEAKPSVEEDGYTSLAMLCPEWPDGGADDNDNDDDESYADSANIHAPSYAELADRFVRMTAAEQGAFSWQLDESSCADGLTATRLLG